jgi:hypothetical protein
MEALEAAVDDLFAGISQVGGMKVTGGSYGWCTAGSSAPGGDFVAIPEADGSVVAGNQFYTLKKR